jgi:putative oxidoreductase
MEIMTDFGSKRIKDQALLIARILLVMLFLKFGWAKLNDYSGTLSYMAATGLPLPSVATVVAILIEFFGAIALILGIWTRPLAILLGVYTLATACIGHQYWAETGADRLADMTNFYKNISVMGGFLLLYVTGAGKWSIDTQLDSRRVKSPSARSDVLNRQHPQERFASP